MTSKIRFYWIEVLFRKKQRIFITEICLKWAQEMVHQILSQLIFYSTSGTTLICFHGRFLTGTVYPLFFRKQTSHRGRVFESHSGRSKFLSSFDEFFDFLTILYHFAIFSHSQISNLFLYYIHIPLIPYCHSKGIQICQMNCSIIKS